MLSSWPVLDCADQPVVSTERWELRLEGEVEEPLRLTWADFLALPQAEDEDEDEDVMDQMRKLTTLLKRHTGLDLGAYKQTSVVRRIERRMGICEVSDFGEYVALLRKNPAECENLAKDMLISVTRFFRDPGAFDKLRETILPQIIKETDARPLRCWVPTWSTRPVSLTTLHSFLPSSMVRVSGFWQ